jgi:hypothetical protein
LIVEFVAKENLKSSFPLRFKARRAEGGVDIRVEYVTPDGLSGKKRVWFRCIFHLIGIPGESPFVSKLRKVESARHSPFRMFRDLQRTSGYAPRFQAFFSALGFSGSTESLVPPTSG